MILLDTEVDKLINNRITRFEFVKNHYFDKILKNFYFTY